MDATKPYKFIGFGAIDATKPYEFIRFGVMSAHKLAKYTYQAFGHGRTYILIFAPWGAPAPQLYRVWGHGCHQTL